MSHDERHGRFVWSELLTRDPARAREFYEPLFGWAGQTIPMAPAGDYTLWSVAGASHAGALAMPPQAEAPPHWLPYVDVDDVDGAAVRCREEGGDVHVEPRDIPNLGRFAVLMDPFGADFAVYRSSQPEPPASDSPPIGSFTWRELATGDVERALEFYGELFGWQRGPAQQIGSIGHYQIVEKDGVPFGGLFVPPPSKPMPPSWTCYVRVADVQESLARVERTGGTVRVPETAVPGGEKIAVCVDPEGAPFGLHFIRGH